MDYESWRKLFDDLLLQGKTIGPEQSAQRIEYTTRNVKRMNAIDTTACLKPEIESFISAVREPQQWVVLTEG
ncbi:MAG TPA: hypothetical protein VEY06_11725 [Flavisolibacter sp.]|jgi:hypothetical protein|nr:hypothetical protein [Flavisolibacter sp.]